MWSMSRSLQFKRVLVGLFLGAVLTPALLAAQLRPPGTGGMAMVGGVCVSDFDYLSSNNLPFLINVEGVMAAPEPAAAGLGLAAVAMVGMLRRRRG